GHSRGGVTYVVSGLPNRIAVVGDSMFASSMGGGGVSYADALRNNREQILTLPDNTILCPGHGPLTTVGEEKKHNPFFAGQIYTYEHRLCRSRTYGREHGPPPEGPGFQRDRGLRRGARGRHCARRGNWEFRQ